MTQTQPLEYNLYADITDPTGGIITGVLLKGGNLDTTLITTVFSMVSHTVIT